MSEFCVINKAEDLFKEFVEDFNELLVDAESEAKSLAQDIELAEERFVNCEEKLEEANSENDTLRDELLEVKAQLRVVETKLETYEGDWRFADDPFREWYKQEIEGGTRHY